MGRNSYHYNFGKVRSIETNKDSLCFTLKDGQTEMDPRYYRIDRAQQENYNAMVSLVYMAADSRLVLQVECEPENANPDAKVKYLVVEWNAQD